MYFMIILASKVSKKLFPPMFEVFVLLSCPKLKDSITGTSFASNDLFQFFQLK